ncbi:MAG: glycine zipper domain-containing protein [Pirellulaceae bacterium]
MKVRSGILVLYGVICLVGAGCHAMNYAERGAGIGGLTGALAGAAIGENHGNAVAGAAIGTAVGALAGTAMGSEMDHEVARSEALIREKMGRAMAGAVSVADVIAMTRAGLSDEVVVSHIRANGVAARPQVPDLIQLRNAGVRDPIIQAMQQTPPPQLFEPVPYGPPVVIEEHYFVAPPGPIGWHRPMHYHGP